LASALLLMGAIALIMFVVVISKGQFDPASLVLAASLLGLGLLLRRRQRRMRMGPQMRGRLLRRMLRREPRQEEDI